MINIVLRIIVIELSCVGGCLLLASEVAPGFLVGAEPNAHQFYVTICLMG
jgi:hypothetical protein